MGLREVKLELRENRLDKYLSLQDELTPEERKAIEEQLRKLEENPFDNEALPKTLLKIRLEEYPIINPEFLSESNQVECGSKIILLPKYTVHKKQKTGKGFDDFSVDFHWKDISTLNKGLTLLISRSPDNNLPLIFEEPLKKLAEFSHYKTKDEWHIVPSRLFKKYKKLASEDDGVLKFTSRFCGIIPDETKRKITEAGNYFRENVYVITETKPTEWKTPRLSKDSLLVGVLENTCYLIDEFKTTSIRNYVKNKFTENS